MRLLIVVGCVACTAAPRFARVEPAPLAASPAPRVRIEPAAQPWWIVQTGGAFWLALPAAASRAKGTLLRPIRTTTVELDDDAYAAVVCAWQIGSDCASVANARAAAHLPLEHAFDDLRARVAATGGSVAAQTRCFAERDRLWCEANAVRADGVVAESDPEGPPSVAPTFTPTRFALSADASIAMVGRVPAPGTTVALWYRPIEVGFQVIDLSRDGTDRQLVGVGATVLARFGVQPQLDLLAGGSTTAVAPNGATNPQFAALYEGFIGASYRSRWQWHLGNGFVQLQIGGARDQGTFKPVFGLHVGLVTPGG